MFVAEKVLLLLVISLTDKEDTEVRYVGNGSPLVTEDFAKSNP